MYFMKIFTFILILPLFIFPQQKELTVDEIYGSNALFPPSLPRVEWINNGEQFSFMRMDRESGGMAIHRHDVASGEESIIARYADLVSPVSGENVSVQNYSWFPGTGKILFTGILPARTLKTGGALYIFDLNENKIIHEIDSEEEQINVQVSPDGSKIGFVRGNNLFVYDLNLNRETQLTFDGNENILNGVFDWVYEEEFSIINAWQWSPDSRHIAFWRLDQTNVPEIQIAKWDSLYMNFHSMRYPKAGSDNSLVQIGVVSAQGGNITWIDLGNETDIYISRINFTSDPNILSLQKLNRLQNKKDFLFADIATGKTELILSETSETWVDPETDDLTFLKDNRFIWSSDYEGYKHLYLYDASGKLINRITSGEWEVEHISTVDEENELIYYVSSERGPIYRDLYVINFNGENKTRLTDFPGNHNVNVSPGGKYFINSYSNVNSLSVIRLYDTGGKEIRVLADKKINIHEEYGLSLVEFLTFTTSDGVTLNASIIRPPDFDPANKYPALIYNYSGPGSQVVRDAWGGPNLLWHQMMAQKGYIIFMLDNRGTGHRGKAFRDLVYKNLGHWETVDMIEGAQYLSSLGYVDPERIGIWGWSYGGYMSALALMKGADHFKAAVSVAPVTHWKFYDTIYTERYMQTPQLNPDGYEESAPLSHVDKLKGKLLLIHGTGDDNVHFQNAVALVNEMIDHNIQFETMFYPERMHGISGGVTRRHLFNLITDFILRNI
jgi:dipeptidyl-peptidase 4